jgi:hypothetical protein
MGCQQSKKDDDEDLGDQSDAQKSASLRQEALRIADEMFGANQGRQGGVPGTPLQTCSSHWLRAPRCRRFHEFYTRLTLTSYGASCKVLTAFHRTSNKKVAVKTIPKVRPSTQLTAPAWLAAPAL